MSAWEGCIYRLSRVRAFQNYLSAASMKFEVVQMEMVTVRTIIKGLCR